MLNDAVLLKNLIEYMERAPAIYHEIFRDNFEPVDDGLASEDVMVMGGTQADAYSVVCECVEGIGRH